MENVYYLSRFITEQCKEQIQTVLYRSVVFLPGRARNTNGIQNTSEGVVRRCCTGLLFLYQPVKGTQMALKTHQRGMYECVTQACCFLYQTVQGTHTAFETHQNVNLYYTSLQFLCLSVQGTHTPLKHTRGWCMNVLHWSGVFFTGQCKVNG